ncbi:MAG: carboxypeptidase-like regulatory domain-containing protein, partial [Armatimonadota bacterium]
STYDSPDLVTYNLTDGTTLEGSITADGLKPGSAYQVKLEGMPTAPYSGTIPAESDVLNRSNWEIGHIGRWWCEDDGWNVDDSDLPSHVGHWVLGYLLFDFFVTDVNGNAIQPLYLDSSFHVLWRTDQRRANRARDGRPRTHRITYDPDVYESPFADQNVRVYAEGETGRPKPGQVTLPPGSYQCRLLLTEETFHNVPPALQSQFPWGRTNYADGGFWAHVLSDDGFAFTITGGGSGGGGTGSIAGKVTGGSRKGLAGVLVSADSGQSDVTNGGGRYEITGVPAGTHDVTASLAGYQPATKTVTVDANQTTKLNFDLVPE